MGSDRLDSKPRKPRTARSIKRVAASASELTDHPLAGARSHVPLSRPSFGCSASEFAWSRLSGRAKRPLFTRNVHLERRKNNVDAITVFIDAMKASMCRGVGASHMIAVVRELFTRREPWRFANDFVTFDDEPRAVGMEDDPLPSQQRHTAVRRIVNRDEIDERVRLVRRKAGPAVVIAQLVE
jgi:hypothetical protein